MSQPSADTPIAYRPAEAGRILGVSRSRLYELIAAGHITARKQSPQVTLVPRAELERYLNSLPTAAGDTVPDEAA